MNALREKVVNQHVYKWRDLNVGRELAVNVRYNMSN